MTAGLQLGVPGVYFEPARRPAGQPTIHLDETGFVGIASRGPVNTPVRVTSWTDFLRWYGGLPRPEKREPTTLLAYAVQAYFAQGGRAAWIVRVGPTDSASATAGFVAGGNDGLRLQAANEGSWGNSLTITLNFVAGAEFSAKVVPGDDEVTHFEVPYGVDIPQHSLLEIGGAEAWATHVINPHIEDVQPMCVLDRQVPADKGGRIKGALITGSLTVADGDSADGYTERFDGLGLHPDHRRFLSKVIDDASQAELWSLNVDQQNPEVVETSTLLSASKPWPDLIRPGPRLEPLTFVQLQSGADRWNAINANSFYDDAPADTHEFDDEEITHRGVGAIGRVSDVGLLCVPDLTWSWSPPTPAPAVRRKRTAEFVRTCGEASQTLPPTAVSPDLWLDPTDPGQLDEIIQRQQRVVDVAILRHRFVVLLDVPRGLPKSDIAYWRTQFGSSHCAAYHPWLGVTTTGVNPGVQFVPPSAFAAGIIASRENRLGIHRGPANELAVGAVTPSNSISDTVAAELIHLPVNVFIPERDGFRLASARTLSTDPALRQLSVRRLMTLVKLVLEQVGNRLVFEPGTPQMRSVLAKTLGAILGDFHRRGAFAGATEADSFFVRCDDQLNTPDTIARGQLIAEVGVAPAEPLEFIVVRILQTADGTEVSERG